MREDHLELQTPFYWEARMVRFLFEIFKLKGYDGMSTNAIHLHMLQEILTLTHAVQIYSIILMLEKFLMKNQSDLKRMFPM